MRAWASWTAKTAVLTLTAGLAATAGGLSGVALASSGDSAVLAASRGGAVSGQAATPAGIPGDICTDTGGLLGIAGAACRNVTLRATRMFRPLPSWPGSGPFRVSRTCPHRPVWPARPPATGPWAAAIPYPGPRCPRPTRA